MRQNDANMRVTKDGFVWKIVTEKAKDIFNNGLFSLFVLHDDESESLIQEFEDLDYALRNGLPIGIEVGKLKETWIGLEIPQSDTTLKVCIGLNLEDGEDLSFCNSEDIKLNGSDPWIKQGIISIKPDRVFDDNHNLIL